MSLYRQSAVDLARRAALGELSAVEIVRAHLDRIAQINPRVNAFVDIRAEHALAEARAQDEAAANGRSRGPLGGVPVTIKSAIEVAGARCETGSPSRKGIVAATDAVVVSRLRAAGAIVIGTTNVAEMLMAYESDNPLHGRTNHPLALDRTPGGSSGGESAAIASGCSAGGIGSDGGGSIRVPAHFTGICGLKPTPGRVPGTGHQPACLGPFSLIGVVGPMARTVADLAAMFEAVAGWDEDDPMSAPVARQPDAASIVGGLRVAYFEDDGRTPVSAETREAVRAAAQAAADAGCAVEEIRPPRLDRAREIWEIVFCEVALLVLEGPLGGGVVDLPILQEYLKHRARVPLSGASLTGAWADRDLVRAEVLRWMRTYRVCICPVASIPAFRHGERAWSIDGREVGYLDAMSYTQWFNVLGNPVVVVPVGSSPEGLPIGVQIVGRPWEEEVVLAVAAAVERHTAGRTKVGPGSDPRSDLGPTSIANGSGPSVVDHN